MLRLARRAPVRGAVLLSLPAGLDGRAAAATAVASALVDGAPLAAGLDRGGHQLVSSFQDRPELVARGLGDGAPWRDARLPKRLRLPDVADPGDETLIEQGIPDLARRVAADVRDDRLQVRRLREDVRTETADGAVVELQHRAVPQHGLALGAAENEPGAAEELRTSSLQPPAPRHAQVAPQDDATLEPEEQVLSRRLDGFEPTAVEPGRELLDRSARVWRLHFEALANENLQLARGACQRIAF